ncbi:hypothetical protein V8F06_001756 [Rhypophila decipiens]
MASKKDMRRPDLIIPYQEPAAKGETGDLQSTIASTLPMAAIFMRNRYVGCRLTFILQGRVCVQHSELVGRERGLKEEQQHARVLLRWHVMSLIVTYLPIFLPPQPGYLRGSATDAPPPVPA